jgi:hypothetical protein
MSWKVATVIGLSLVLTWSVSPVVAQSLAGPVRPVASDEIVQPTAFTRAVQPLDTVQQVQVAPPDLEAVKAEDVVRAASGMAPRYAIPHEVYMTPGTIGTWEELDSNTMLWRLRIVAPDAVSINLGFVQYSMPPGGQLIVHATDGSFLIRAFTANDNASHGELWTPVCMSDDIIVELTLPSAELGDLKLELGFINYGYRGFESLKPASKDAAGPRSGACNIDVVCPQGALWAAEIPAVANISTGGSCFCTGFMMNNTANDRRNFFQTAYHCGITSSNAPSLVAYWNYQNSTCRTPGSPESGGAGDGTLTQFNTGSTFRATSSSSDFTLVELTADPNPSWHVSYAGWDRTHTLPTTGAGIHHPNNDEKRITFFDSLYHPSHDSSWGCSAYPGPGDGSHIRVYWSAADGAVTEPGSSGSPLFDNNHHVIGQLHGGPSACGATGDNLSDCYGRVYVSWTGGGSSSTRLSDWLDYSNTGATFVNTLSGNDNTAPNPDPMTFATPPSPASSTSITMTATTATDVVSPPVQYLFDFMSGGPGGADSAWQASTTYVNYGLTPNTIYTYRVKARDSASPAANQTAYSSNASGVTFIGTPTGITFGTVASDSIVLNATGSLNNLMAGSSGVYFNSTTSGGNGGINAWVKATTDTATGLTPNTSYTFQAKGRNMNGIETVYGASASKVTLAAIPAAPTLSGATMTTLNLSVNANGNPAGTEFVVQCTGSTPADANWNGKYLTATGTAGASAVWQTQAQWGTITVQGLQAFTTYTFAVKARNSALVETAFSAGASRSTIGRLGDMNGDGVVDGDDIQAFVTCKIAGGDGCGPANMTVSAFVDCLLNAGTCP